jgi:hypothetical protein
MSGNNGGRVPFNRRCGGPLRADARDHPLDRQDEDRQREPEAAKRGTDEPVADVEARYAENNRVQLAEFLG